MKGEAESGKKEIAEKMELELIAWGVQKIAAITSVLLSNHFSTQQPNNNTTTVHFFFKHAHA